MTRIPNWSKMSSLELWQAWRALHPSDELALAAAVWTGNRLVKNDYCRNTRRSFYQVRDHWMCSHQKYLTRGLIARVETKTCRECWGAGTVEHHDPFETWDGECDHCNGTGIWSERTLYLHAFNIEGMPFKFHSYVKPDKLGEERGADLESYGTAFTDDEEKVLPLPLSGILQMLRYVTFAGLPGTGEKVESAACAYCGGRPRGCLACASKTERVLA